ncbi:HoxN/HupN/NixA family nickel/cobalt transporter [Streptomyces albogriseolus]|uniref:Nickel/cobalt efflux system n=2 Tax=unclassified Streptomyces TaxID=2593676 RepID=V9Z1F3_9ACTN|nr:MULTISPECIES: HoxN/HupN/NixA family nickel/cobalt transporter [unclassified Streptomyces]AHE38894.1 High-affinity nickel-transporter [Streptomyces sp. FR1]AHE39375.1 High-affinity nickel-transporter [Streptomyces sp. F2]
MTAAPHTQPGLVRRIRGALTPREWARAGGLAAAILALHVIGWGTLLLVVVPQHFDLGSQGAFGIGLGVTAYVLGMRHAFDADHIAAIDNTTRKLISDGQRPLSVGFFFSLGHSTVVFLLALLFALGVRSLAGPVQDDGSALQQTLGLIGTSVSGVFLYVIAAFNLVALIGILRVFRRMRTGGHTEADLETQLSSGGGVMTRILGRATRAVAKPWHMYPLGFLFGLGFDTATEVSLLFLAAGAAGAGIPWYAILCLPVLFAAGMSLLDTIDGSFMNFAYSWAFSNPVRKVFYNITVTGLSVAAALIIGTVELLSIAAEKLTLHGAFWDWVGGIDLNSVGYAVVLLFVVTWAAALLIWRYGRIEEKWAVAPQSMGD